MNYVLDPAKLAIIKDAVDIAQGVTIIAATVFTARWTYRTFAQKEKIEELKEFKRLIEEYHHAIQIFCAVVRQTAEITDPEIAEKIQLAGLHNRLVGLASLNLYTKKAFRERVRLLVGSWLVGDRISKMQRRPGWEATEEDRVKLWNAFDVEYREALGLVDAEADRIL